MQLVLVVPVKQTVKMLVEMQGAQQHLLVQQALLVVLLVVLSITMQRQVQPIGVPTTVVLRVVALMTLHTVVAQVVVVQLRLSTGHRR
jgi:hypothetical protein